jgi:hypothetical protein
MHLASTLLSVDRFIQPEHLLKNLKEWLTQFAANTSWKMFYFCPMTNLEIRNDGFVFHCNGLLEI